MKYQIVVERRAEKFISRLPRPDKERVLQAIARLPDDGDIYKDAIFDTNENPGPRHQEAGNIKKSRAFTVPPVIPAEL